MSGPKPPRRSTKVKVPPLVFVSHQKTLVQKYYLPPIPGHGAFVDVQPPGNQAAVQALAPSRELADDMGFTDDPFIVDLDEHVDPPVAS